MNISFIQAKHFTRGRRKTIDLIVIHTMEYPERTFGAEWCANYFAGANAPAASAHYCVDNDSIVQCVREEDEAWHANQANPRSIGIEHAGYAAQSEEEWLDDYSRAMLLQSATLVADICRRRQIPVVRPAVEELSVGAPGIVGHNDAVNAYAGGRGHTDPGPHFPWDWYLDRVREHLANLQGAA